MLSIQNNYGYTPLHFAAYYGNPEILNKIREKLGHKAFMEVLKNTLPTESSKVEILSKIISGFSKAAYDQGYFEDFKTAIKESINNQESYNTYNAAVNYGPLYYGVKNILKLTHNSVRDEDIQIKEVLERVLFEGNSAKFDALVFFHINRVENKNKIKYTIDKTEYTKYEWPETLTEISFKSFNVKNKFFKTYKLNDYLNEIGFTPLFQQIRNGNKEGFDATLADLKKDNRKLIKAMKIENKIYGSVFMLAVEFNRYDMLFQLLEAIPKDISTEVAKQLEEKLTKDKVQLENKLVNPSPNQDEEKHDDQVSQPISKQGVQSDTTYIIKALTHKIYDLTNIINGQNFAPPAHVAAPAAAAPPPPAPSGGTPGGTRGSPSGS